MIHRPYNIIKDNFLNKKRNLEKLKRKRRQEKTALKNMKNDITGKLWDVWVVSSG